MDQRIKYPERADYITERIIHTLQKMETLDAMEKALDDVSRCYQMDGRIEWKSTK